jgi:hypothetical protein
MRTRLLRDPQGWLLPMMRRSWPTRQARHERGRRAAATGTARGLYERVVTASADHHRDHGWFWQLIARACPAPAFVRAGAARSSDRLRIDAWLHFSAALLQPSSRGARGVGSADRRTGDVAARNLLLQMLERRAEW